MAGLALFLPPAAEPLTAAEAALHCRIDASNQEPPPAAITAALASPAAPGNLSAGAYRWLVTFVTADGETQAGEISAPVTIANPAVNGKAALSAIPIGGSLVTARKLYRTQAGGSVFYLAATIADNVTSIYTDNIADASLGAQAPLANTTSDPALRTLIMAARVNAESMTRSALVTQTWDLYLDRFPQWEMHIPLPPLQSVSAITYVDTDGVTQALAADQYQVDANSAPGRITPAYGKVWPIARWQNNAVKVRFVCGYGDAAAVPENIKLWMKARIKHFYDQGAPVNVGGVVTEFPRSYVDGLLDASTYPSYAWESC